MFWNKSTDVRQKMDFDDAMDRVVQTRQAMSQVPTNADLMRSKSVRFLGESADIFTSW